MDQLNFGARVWLALSVPWRLLFDGAFAARVAGADSTPALAGAVEERGDAPPGPDAVSPEAGPGAQPSPGAPAPQVSEVVAELDTTPALQLLGILQREGRFVDFLQEDVAGFSDAEIGAAARVVHEGCKRGLEEIAELAPIRTEAEGDPVTLEPGYDARAIRVTGNVVGEPPFRGSLAHHGWRVTQLTLPTSSPGHDPQVVAPAEVEL